jgi:hypothetical protein
LLLGGADAQDLAQHVGVVLAQGGARPCEPGRGVAQAEAVVLVAARPHARVFEGHEVVAVMELGIGRGVAEVGHGHRFDPGALQGRRRVVGRP